MKGKLRTMTGVLTVGISVWIGAVFLTEGHTVIGAALVAFGALRAVFVLRDIWWYLTPDDESEETAD